MVTQTPEDFSVNFYCMWEYYQHLKRIKITGFQNKEDLNSISRTLHLVENGKQEDTLHMRHAHPQFSKHIQNPILFTPDETNQDRSHEVRLGSTLFNSLLFQKRNPAPRIGRKADSMASIYCKKWLRIPNLYWSLRPYCREIWVRAFFSTQDSVSKQLHLIYFR